MSEEEPGAAQATSRKPTNTESSEQREERKGEEEDWIVSVREGEKARGRESNE